MQTGLHGAEAIPSPLGDLLECEIGEVAQDDDLPLVVGKLLQRLVQRGLLGEARCGIRERVLGAFVEPQQPDVTAPPKAVTASIDEDPLEPGLEPPLVPQVCEAFPRNGSGVLYGILRLCLAAQQHGGQAIRPGELPIREVGECTRATRVRAIVRRAIGRGQVLLDHGCPDAPAPWKVQSSPGSWAGCTTQATLAVTTEISQSATARNVGRGASDHEGHP